MKKQYPGLRTNKGSAIVTVLVAVAFVSILGTVLLFMTYTGFQMKVTERESKENFYDAEAAMNEIRIQIQSAVSTSIARANTDVLEHYNEALTDSDDLFKTTFLETMFDWKPTEASTEYLLYNESTFNLDDGSTYTGPCYNCAMLTEFIVTAEPPYVTVRSGFPSSTGMGKLVLVTDDEDAVTDIILKDITVSYVKDGFESNITTDIRVTIPDFSYETSSLVTTAIQDYVIIADDDLLQTSGGAINLDGNVYAGQVNLSNNGNSLTVGNESSDAYLFISPGTVSVDMSSSLSIGENTDLWARRIEVGTGSALTLSGETYVADDLALDGDGAAATLSGRYYGFGSNAENASSSSSIVINGHGTDLTLSSTLNTLMLAGQSFIGTGSVGSANDDLLTGESISAKSNQLAYLIPPECLMDIPPGYEDCLSTNPAVFPHDTAVPSSETLNDCVDTSADLWNGGGSMEDHGASVQLVYVPITDGPNLVYFYMRFDTPRAASDYFMDYFQDNSDKIGRYMELYSSSLSLSEETDNLFSGDAPYYDDTSELALLPPSSSSFTSAATRLGTMFENLCLTLSPTNPGELDSVYTYVVNETAVDALPDTTTLFAAPDGTVVGMITRANSTEAMAVLTNYPDMKVIISTKNVIVNSPLNGLIIAGGTVDLRRSLYLDKSGVSTALQATNAAGETMLDYLKIGSGSSGGTSADNVTWDMESLVSYQNWSKH